MTTNSLFITACSMLLLQGNAFVVPSESAVARSTSLNIMPDQAGDWFQSDRYRGHESERRYYHDEPSIQNRRQNDDYEPYDPAGPAYYPENFEPPSRRYNRQSQPRQVRRQTPPDHRMPDQWGEYSDREDYEFQQAKKRNAEYQRTRRTNTAAPHYYDYEQDFYDRISQRRGERRPRPEVWQQDVPSEQPTPTQKATSSTPASTNNNRVTMMMTQENKRVLIEELGYRRADVKRLKFDLALELVKDRIRCPKEGVPASWCTSSSSPDSLRP